MHNSSQKVEKKVSPILTTEMPQAISQTIDVLTPMKKHLATKSSLQNGFRLPYDDSYALDVLVERPNQQKI